MPLRLWLYYACAVFIIWKGMKALVYLQPPQSERMHRIGYVVGATFSALTLLMGGVGMLAGFEYLRWLAIPSLLLTARRLITEFATGVAEGRKASALAAAVEYVQGRAAPRAFDYVLALVLTSPVSLAPLVVLIWGPPPK